MTRLNVHGVDISEVTDFPDDGQVVQFIPFNEITQCDVIIANSDHTFACKEAGFDANADVAFVQMPVDAFVAAQLLKRHARQAAFLTSEAQIDASEAMQAARKFVGRTSALGRRAWPEFSAIVGQIEADAARRVATTLARLSDRGDESAFAEALAIIDQHRASNPVDPEEMTKKRRVKKVAKHRLGRPLKFTRPATRKSTRLCEEGPVRADID